MTDDTRHRRDAQCGVACDCDGALDRRTFVERIGRLGVAAAGVRIAPLALTSEKRYPVPATPGAAIDSAESVIIARVGQRVYAFSLACPHQRTALRVSASGGFRCPKHKSEFTESGALIDGRAKRSLDRLPIRLVDGALAVDLDRVFREDRQKEEWEKAFVELSQ